MIAVNCYRCGNELGIQGMLIFDVPDLDDRSLKLHVCAPCAPVVVEWLRGGTPGQPHPTERPAAPPGDPERRIDPEDWLKALLKETLPFLKRARDHWPETSNPHAFIDEIDELEARIDAALAPAGLTTPAPPPSIASILFKKGYLLTTTHVLFEGHPICGFMSGTVPSGWPDWHNWVSNAEVTWHDGETSIPLSDHCTPCERCLRFASPPPFLRNRV
jgi:hypothetical protein